ncbi:putative chromosome-partitioning protein ParB [Luteitalea pratensis]|uniref:Putative chromosome-partitioning protein ParB n=2 Tax=Luteitalea pratensis TaxID=1855912 RepID=A0A143PNQ1_LUTPR|nr:putative chromosome-partitioning protein ParB [Luteitalea pratensis]
MSKRGLPETVRMRHDAHYVETLTASAGAPVGRMISIEHIDPNPNQPRQVMGDLSELIASVKEHGLIEPIVVRQRGSRFQIVAGERRYQAAVRAGIEELPVVIRDVDDVGILEVALVENLQRKDLTAFEEAEALQALCQKAGYTHEKLAQKLGKSRTAITESLSLNQMPDPIKQLCRLADISSKSLLLQVVRQGEPEKMAALVEQMSRPGGMTRQEVREQVKPKAAKRGRPQAFTFTYKAPTKQFAFSLSFKKADVEPDEVIETLERILDDLRTQRASAAKPGDGVRPDLTLD